MLGTGPRLIKKRIYRAAVSQRLRNTGLDNPRGPTNLLFNAYRGLLQQVYGGRRVMLTNSSSAKIKNAWSSASTTTNAFMPCTPGQPLPITILQVHIFSRTDVPNTFHTPSLFILFFSQRYNHSIKFYQCFVCSLVCMYSIRWEHVCEWYVIKRAEGTVDSHIRLICSILQPYINAL
jgi:hypothetical protein